VRSTGVADFKISGVIGRGVGDGVQISGGSQGGGSDTLTGGQVLPGGGRGGVGALTVDVTRRKRIRAPVTTLPPRVDPKGGTCDRGLIKRVVDTHMPAVQSCYERQLMTQPGIQGKIVFDWEIVAGGRVGSARQHSSSMPSPSVSMCVLSLIRSWSFAPCPYGGPVQVRYPFVFRAGTF
jgi:hypothetical protein